MSETIRERLVRLIASGTARPEYGHTEAEAKEWAENLLAEYDAAQCASDEEENYPFLVCCPECASRFNAHDHGPVEPM